MGEPAERFRIGDRVSTVGDLGHKGESALYGGKNGRIAEVGSFDVAVKGLKPYFVRFDSSDGVHTAAWFSGKELVRLEEE